MKYRKKPVVIEAVQYIGTNSREVKDFCGEGGDDSQTYFLVRNGAGPQAWNYVKDETWSSDIVAAIYDRLHSTWVGVKRNQWIIRGVTGELYPCDPDVFEITYDRVDA